MKGEGKKLYSEQVYWLYISEIFYSVQMRNSPEKLSPILAQHHRPVQCSRRHYFWSIPHFNVYLVFFFFFLSMQKAEAFLIISVYIHIYDVCVLLWPLWCSYSVLERLEINTNPFKEFVHLTTNSLTCTTSEIQTKPTKIQNLRFYQAVK